MENISCTCKACGAAIGDFPNLWTQIGRSYFSPIVEPQDALAIVSHGPLRLGEKGTLVDACQLQDIACAQCNTILGIKCLNTPTNHVLDENQILLRATSVSSISFRDGREVDFVVKRYLKLREPSRAGTEQFGSSTNGDRARTRDAPGAAAQNGYHFPEGPERRDILQLQADLEAQRGDIERIDSAGFKVVSALDEAVSRVEGDLTKMRQTLSELQREIRGNHDDVSSLKTEITDVKRLAQDHTAIKRLEGQLNSANNAIEEVRRNMEDVTTKFRQDLAGVKSEVRENSDGLEGLRALVRDRISTRDHAKEMAAVRGELAQLRKQMDESRSKPPESFPSRELDILTTNISKIGNRASQVESLQMEFEIFKGRIERMEGARQDRPSLHNSPKDVSPYDQYDNDDYRAGDELPTRRKRRSSGPDGSLVPGSNSTKRTAFASQLADTPDKATEWEPNSSSPVLPHPGNARLTKTGKVDKRTQRASARPFISISSDGKTTANRKRG